MYGHKVMYEALQQLRFDEFVDTLDERSKENVCSPIISMKDTFEERRLQDFVKCEDFKMLITQ